MGKWKRINWEEVDPYIIEHFKDKSIRDIAKDLGLNDGTIGKRTLKLGLRKFKRNVWTIEQDKFMQENYPLMGGRYCSDKLNLPITSVNKRATTLGIYYVPKDEYIGTQGYLVEGKSNERQYVHRRIMEEKLGRKLTSDEIVHHEDEDKLNNLPENLELTNRSDHMKMHWDDIHASKFS